MSESFPPCTVELEQQRLALLNWLIDRKYPSPDGFCGFCGLRPGRPHLCEPCEGRRLRLAERYPGVTAKTSVSPQVEASMTSINVIKQSREWLPYREPE